MVMMVVVMVVVVFLTVVVAVVMLVVIILATVTFFVTVCGVCFHSILSFVCINAREYNSINLLWWELRTFRNWNKFGFSNKLNLYFWVQVPS